MRLFPCNCFLLPPCPHLGLLSEDLYVASPGCCGEHPWGPNPDAKVRQLTDAECRMQWKAPGRELMPERRPERMQDLMSEYMLDSLSVGGGHSKKVAFQCSISLAAMVSNN